ncbi:MAG: 50S ribosomal protein L9 [Spirochaetaceae bacterium]|jgi:large subunit ribosomal protein L9|nr:50S ribosomal protein L9 [Spirochaetaceae bacterium]
MKVILDKDLATLGEEGDVKEVARGYARNYLFPRGIALPYNERTVKLFEARKDAIETRKQEKRQDAVGLKEKIEALNLEITMPAGANGKLYGAVTAQTLADELGKQGFQIERKRIELPGNSIKSTGRYKVTVKLYENASAECSLTVEGQELRTETKTTGLLQRGRRRGASGESPAAETPPAAAGAGTATETPAAAAGAETPPAEAAAGAAVETSPAAAGAAVETPPEPEKAETGAAADS